MSYQKLLKTFKMTTFTLKFLLAFSFKEKFVKEKKERQPKGGKKRDSKTVEPESDPPYVIRLNNSSSVAHIEYDLLPGRLKPYYIDILCWKNAAKIYTADGTKIFKTITKGGLTFVPVCVTHFVKELSIENLLSLRNSVIEFNVFTDRNKLGNAAKSNKTEVVYIREIDVERIDFVEAFVEKSSQTGPIKRSLQTRSDTTQATSDDTRSFSKSVDTISRMIFEEDFSDVLCEIVDYETDDRIPRDQIRYRDFIPPCNPPDYSKPKESAKEITDQKSAKTSQKPKRQGKPEKNEKTKYSLRMQGEIFFTDVGPVFKLENYRSEVSKIIIIPHVEDLLTRAQKIHLNPIIIKLFTLHNFPHEIFYGSGFTDIYCKYTIPQLAECKSITKPLANTISFAESHIFPTHNVPKIKLLEFLENKSFVIEVYGIQRYQHVEPNPKMFGEKPSDSDISNIHKSFRSKCLESEDNAKAKEILLAYCTCDLSSLLKNVWDFKARLQLHTPESRIIANDISRFSTDDMSMSNQDSSCDFWSFYGVAMNDINLAGISFNNNNRSSPLKEYILLQNSTDLCTEAYLLSPQSAALLLHQIPNTYKRLLMIAFDKVVGQRFFGDILRHNQSIACGGQKNEDVLTGFLIDNGNNFVIYVEGHSIGYILNIWLQTDNLTPTDAKVFFNTDQAYESRLYNICNKWSGFYIINMKIPLELIFKNQKIYIKGNLPILCQKALMKLNLMFLTSTMKRMFQLNLFPTMDELVSLDIEYGVPCGWKSLVESYASSTDSDNLSVTQNETHFMS